MLHQRAHRAYFVHIECIEALRDILSNLSRKHTTRLGISTCFKMRRIRFAALIRLPCLFGCADGEDRLAHYANCPYLYSRLKYLHPPTSPNPLTYQIKVGVCDPRVHSLKLIARSCSAYQNFKFVFAPLLSQSGELHGQCLAPLATMHFTFLGSFAEALRTEAAEIGIVIQVFDPVAFSRFLSGMT